MSVFLRFPCISVCQRRFNVLGDLTGMAVLFHHELHGADTELKCNSILEERGRKKVPYHPVSREDECDNDKIPNNETKIWLKVVQRTPSDADALRCMLAHTADLLNDNA